ncbi:hypothetical protein DL991_37690 [Amycolatopsis sp. WAC 01375]|uniref:hypothetical protein n=1 Tax=unclassified Amycolatopsis TaxID=2618356 RepID=UPI000F7B77D3|nr:MULTISPECIES: hypothetical protein [unclassified Amycolatopsis]RSM70394.1 hypothetical protein DL991_37690 [Amycolatopsis sp. WAC 01375]RSN29415.1 hypothetical protein DL990_24710 [Amycolatopsis sp. WAC 01416]
MSDKDDRPFTVGGDFSVKGSNFAGRDQHIGDTVGGDKVGRDKVTNTKVRFGLGVLALALVGGGGYIVSQELGSSPTDVVYQEGLDGALNTVSAIRQAEIDLNAADWCVLASAKSGDTCRDVIASAFTRNPEMRAEINDVVIGGVAGSNNAAQVNVSHRGAKVGVLPMRWDGKRWEIDPGAYLLAVNNGGVVMTAVLNAHQCGAFLGTTTGCKK